MSLIHILGSDSGTEPMPGRQHTAWVLEHQGRLYWFDAGENCGWTAYNMGLDPHQVRQIFISHPHIDHTGGLPNLLWLFRKLMYVRNVQELPPVDLYTPSIPTVEHLIAYLESAGESLHPAPPGRGYTLNLHRIADGPVFQDDAIAVEARHNLHLGQPAPGEAWKSFSFRITLGEKVIVYSGDVGSIDDMGDWLERCDWLLMESGHHHPLEVCQTLAERGAQIRHLLWVHHGRRLLADVFGALHRDCMKAFPAAEVLVAHDHSSFEI